MKNSTKKTKKKIIAITQKHEKSIVAFCTNELNYQINECLRGPIEYKSEIKAQLKLLKLLGYEEISKSYKKQFKEALRECKKLE